MESQLFNVVSASSHGFPYTCLEADANPVQILLLHPVPATRDVCFEKLQVWAGVRAGLCLQYSARLLIQGFRSGDDGATCF